MGAMTRIAGVHHLSAARWGQVGTRWRGVGVSPPPHLPTSPYRGEWVVVGTPGHFEVGTIMLHSMHASRARTRRATP